MKTILKYLIPACIAIAILAYAALYFLSSRTRFNDSYVNGNTAGNLYNNGLFCEKNGMLYFSNPSDSHYLYSMDLATGKTKKLTDDVASYINADDNYVYYVRNNIVKDSQFAFLHFNTNSLCRYDLKTGNVKLLDIEPSIYASLLGNYIYYIHYDTDTSSTLYRVKVDGSGREQIDQTPYLTCSANGQYLYYNGITDDHNIYRMDTASGSSQTVAIGNYWMPSADNEAIYFLDCAQNYSLMKQSRSAAAPVQLTADRIETYNVSGNLIVFQRNNLNGDAALCSMNTDGSNYRVIREGNFSNINIAAQYVYFTETGMENTIYRMPVNNPGDISIFNP